jgi:mono/diheme cytochrome c family protein
MARKDGRRRGSWSVVIPWWRITRALTIVLLLAIVAVVASLAMIRSFPQLFFALAERLPRTAVIPISGEAKDDERFFKYGSIGNEANQGFPFKIWVVLPKTCSPLIGNAGYASFGFVYEEPSSEAPIGMSRVRLGWSPFEVEQIAINCSVCHVQTYKFAQNEARRIFVGGAANLLDSQRYLRFLVDCAASSGFDTENVLRAMRAREPSLSWIERQLYRYVLIPITRDAILDRIGSRYAWTWSRPTWGPGRVDPFNPVKFDYLKQPIDDTIGTSDMMPPWNAAAKEAIRTPTPWHRDGLSWDLKEVIINSALGDGTSRFGYRDETVDRLLRYLRELKSPAAPLAIDPALLAQGSALFQATCANCHAPTGQRAMTIIPLAEIGTDGNRWRMWTTEATAAYNNYDKDGKDENGNPFGFPWTLDQFRKLDGYLAQPLNGIWLTGPYLHNGSVPSLDDLLKPPDQRPTTFVRGLEVIDLVKGGYVAPSCRPQYHSGPGFCYDTRFEGNHNGGHAYGTALTEAERRALVHYLLTL